MMDTTSILSSTNGDSRSTDVPDMSGNTDADKQSWNLSTIPVTTVCLVGDCRNDQNVRQAAEYFYDDIRDSDDGIDFIKSQVQMVFIMNEFSATNFKYLVAANKQIYGPTILIECYQMRKQLPVAKRPLYCQSMQDVIACFSGINDKDELASLVNFIHYMGGSVRKTYTDRVTHLVAAVAKGEKYRLAVGWGTPVMSEKWVTETWKRRDIPFTSALNEELKQYKLPPFSRLRLCFYGFGDAEQAEMTTLASQLDAKITSADVCTHFVVEGSYEDEDTLREKSNRLCHIVSEEWFWISVQLNECANEDIYLIGDKSKKRPLSPCSSACDTTPLGRNASKRGAGTDLHAANRLPSTCVSFLDASSDVASALGEHMFSVEDLEHLIKSPRRIVSKRQQIAIELQQTENNYCQILCTILRVFKQPLEKPDQPGGPLLDSTEIKIIFGQLPAIFDVHKKILNELTSLLAHWNDNRCIGPIWTQHEEELTKCYPPFVNFFEEAKEVLANCDKQRPRFHAFLKVCRTKQECNRESLQELLIRPVQRLPSVILLLNDLLKHSEKNHPDYQQLLNAIEALKRTLTFINEDKRKTEEQLKMFDIVNDIENCPPLLLSSQRQFKTKTDALDLSGSYAPRASTLTLYLFNDCLEIAKKRQKSIRNDQRRSPTKKQALKTRKHRELLFLSTIRRVINVLGSEGEQDLFCLTIRNTLNDSDHLFQYISSSDTADGSPREDKRRFLTLLCNQIQTTSGRIGMNVEELDADSLQNGTDLAVAINKHARPSTRRLNRAFSFSNNSAHSTQMRRTVSQAVVAWASGTLRRISRSNLRINLQNIVEETPEIRKV